MIWWSTDDYFVSDSCRENLRLLIVHIFHLTRGFGTVCACRTGFHDFRNIFRIYFIPSISQIKLCPACSMSKNSILNRGFSSLNFFIPFRNETDDYFVNDSRRENLRPLIVHIFHLMRGFERFFNVKHISTIFEI